jgi:hypothetical protein
MKDIFDLQNPWRNPGYTFPQTSYIKRNVFDHLYGEMGHKEVTVVVGSRQVGKTFLMKKLIEKLLLNGENDPRQLFYFNFDSLDLIELVRNDRDFITFLDQYGVAGRIAYVFLDEAQRVPDVGLLIKRYYDLGLNIKFVISGSSSLQIKGQVKETLTGRKRLFELYPITFEEFLNYKGVDVSSDLDAVYKFESSHYQRLLEEFVLFGGYPGVVTTNSLEEKKSLLKEIYNSYVQKDISDFLKIEDGSGFNRLVQFASAKIGGLCKVNEISKNVRLSRHFVDKYLFALEEAYVISRLSPYFVNLGKAIGKTRKLFFCDTGIRNAIFGHFGSLKQRLDAGLLIENFIFCELIKCLDKNRLWFYRTSAGSEIDFLFVEGNQTTPIEVKYGASRQKIIPKAFDSLTGHTDLKKSIIVTKDYIYKEKKGAMDVAFLPAWAAYSLGNEIIGDIH